MPRIERNANVVWDGNLARGSGRISGGTGAFENLGLLNERRADRQGQRGQDEPRGASAAAHAACFATSLAGELTRAGISARAAERHGEHRHGRGTGTGTSDRRVAAAQLATAATPLSQHRRREGPQVRRQSGAALLVLHRHVQRARDPLGPLDHVRRALRRADLHGGFAEEREPAFEMLPLTGRLACLGTGAPR